GRQGACLVGDDHGGAAQSLDRQERTHYSLPFSDTLHADRQDGGESRRQSFRDRTDGDGYANQEDVEVLHASGDTKSVHAGDEDKYPAGDEVAHQSHCLLKRSLLSPLFQYGGGYLAELGIETGGGNNHLP